MSTCIQATVQHGDHRGYGAAQWRLVLSGVAGGCREGPHTDPMYNVLARPRSAIALRGFVWHGSRKPQSARHHGVRAFRGCIQGDGYAGKVPRAIGAVLAAVVS